MVYIADAIIVLGRGIKQDGSLPLTAKLRVKVAVHFFNQKLAPFIVFSTKFWGFQRFIPEITEAEAMKRLAIKLGIPETAIIKEEISEDTIGNAYFTKVNVVDKNKWKDLIIVTSIDHLERTKYCFEKIYGWDYNIQYIAAKHGLSQKELKKVMRLERIFLYLTQRHLRNIKSGDTESLKKMLFKKHVMYKNGLLKKLFKLIVSQPYNT